MTRTLLAVVLVVLMFPTSARAVACSENRQQIVELAVRDSTCTTARRVAKLVIAGGRIPNWRCRATVRGTRIRTVCRRGSAVVIVVWHPRSKDDPTSPPSTPVPLPVPVPPLPPVPVPPLPGVPVP